MVLYALTAALGLASLALATLIVMRQLHRLNRRLDSHGKALTAIAEHIGDGEPEPEPETPPGRRLHLVRDASAALIAAAVLLRHKARAHPGRTAAITAVAAGLIIGALLTLPGAPRRPSPYSAGPTAASIPTPGSTAALPTASATSTPPPTPPGTTGPHAPQGTTTPQPGSTVAPTSAAPPFAPLSGTTLPTGPQPSPTAPYPPGPSPTSTGSTATSPASGPSTTPPSTTPSSPPGPPPCVLALDINNLIELRLLCP